MAAPLLDERPAYGNLPNWVAHGLPATNVWLPQTQLANGAALSGRYETPMLPPIYAGRTTKDTTPRLLEPRMRVQTLQTRSLDAGYPWATDVKPEAGKWSAYNVSGRKRDIVKLPVVVNGVDGQPAPPNDEQNSIEAEKNKRIDEMPMQQNVRYSTSGWRRNLYNSHAKQGFKFWMEEKKPFSKSSKYTFGAYRTFLGLGNAPRN